MSLLTSPGLCKWPDLHDKVVEKEATAQTSNLERDLRAEQTSARRAGKIPPPLVPPTPGMADETGVPTPYGSPPPSPPPSPKGSRPASPPSPTTVPPREASREDGGAPMDTDDVMTVTPSSAVQPRTEIMPTRTDKRPQTLPPPATAVGSSTVKVAFKGNTFQLRFCRTNDTVADFFLEIQKAISYSPSPDKALTMVIGQKTWQMGEVVNSTTPLCTADSGLSGLPLRPRDMQKWLAVGAPVWYVTHGTEADRPAVVVDRRGNPPSYTIKFHYETKLHCTERSSLRPPVLGVATVRVRVEAGGTHTVCAPLDETTCDEFIELLSTVLHATLRAGHPGVQSFKFRGKSNGYGDSSGSLFLTELGLRPENQICVTLNASAPSALPSGTANIPPSSEAASTPSGDHLAVEGSDGPSDAPTEDDAVILVVFSRDGIIRGQTPFKCRVSSTTVDTLMRRIEAFLADSPVGPRTTMLTLEIGTRNYIAWGSAMVNCSRMLV